MRSRRDDRRNSRRRRDIPVAAARYPLRAGLGRRRVQAPEQCGGSGPRQQQNIAGRMEIVQDIPRKGSEVCRAAWFRPAYRPGGGPEGR